MTDKPTPPELHTSTALRTVGDVWRRPFQRIYAYQWAHQGLGIQEKVDKYASDDIIRNGDNHALTGDMLGAGLLFWSGWVTDIPGFMVAGALATVTPAVLSRFQELSPADTTPGLQGLIGRNKRYLAGASHIVEGMAMSTSAAETGSTIKWIYSELATAGGVALVLGRDQIAAWRTCGRIFTPFYVLNKWYAAEALQTPTVDSVLPCDVPSALSVIPYDYGTFARTYFAGSPRRKALMEPNKSGEAECITDGLQQ